MPKVFEPHSSEEIAAAVEEVFDASGEWPARGLARAAAFTWEEAARAHDAVYSRFAA